MAEGLAKQLLAEVKGVPIEQLEEAGVRVKSAGVMPGGGSPASAQAVAAMRQEFDQFRNTWTRESKVV